MGGECEVEAVDILQVEICFLIEVIDTDQGQSCAVETLNRREEGE